MNLKKFIAVIKKIFSKSRGITKLPYFKRYLALALALTLVFTIFTFPYEMIIINQLKKIEGKNFRSISVKQMDVNLIGESYVENLAVTLMNGDSVSIDSLTADISFISLIRKRFVGNIMASAAAYSSKQIKVECAANLNIDLKLDESGTIPSDGKIKAIINNARLTTGEELLAGFPLPEQIRISSINVDLDIVNRALSVKDFTVSGKDIRGKISGSAALEPILGNSKLNLKISVEPESEVLSEFQGLLKQFIDDSGKISMLLSGTAARPRTSLGKSGGKKEKSEIPPFSTNPEE
jgi:hypothetical protein